VRAFNLKISIVIPVHNGGEIFAQCLDSLQQCIPADTEVIVVDDGSIDNSAQLAQIFGAKVVTLPTNGGPARARNIGAKIAQGDLLLFIDADVTINPQTLPQTIAILSARPDLAALIGSYDDEPGAPNFLSQYKNLCHHYTHQTGAIEASTFWGACGAIRRDIFLAIGGFDENYRYPSVEDIDLGYRLKKAGYRIELCKTIQVKHLKCWKVVNLLTAEFCHRALPWTALIWRDRQFVNDLNLQISSRISILLAYGILLTIAIAFYQIETLSIGLVLTLTFLSINLPLYQFFDRQRGWWFTLRAIFWHWLYFIYGGLAFAIGTIDFAVRNLTSHNFSSIIK
jgi:glycosyltransferase involved in cell wall biosynthesis